MSASGSRTLSCPGSCSPSSATSACSACTWRATAARAPARRRTAWRCRELEAGDSGLRSFVSVQGSLAMFPIRTYGSQEQKQEWLPRMAAGTAVGCFGLTEPDRGSDPGDMQTRARRDGGDWVLNGRKMWITNGPVADVAVVWAQAEAGPEEPAGVRGFVVPTGTAGFSAAEITHKMSLRASLTGELVMDDVRLPGDAVLPGVRGLGPAVLPERGALRHPLGGSGRGPGVLRGGPGLRRDPRAVRPADRGLPADPAEAHGDGGADRHGRAAGAPPRRAQGGRDAHPRAGQRGQAQQRPARDRRRPQRPDGAGAPTGSRWSTP